MRYFSRGGSGKRKARPAPSGCTQAQADGPVPFSAQRLLAIAHALLAAVGGVASSSALLLHGEALSCAVEGLLRARLLLRCCAHMPGSGSGSGSAGGGAGSAGGSASLASGGGGSEPPLSLSQQQLFAANISMATALALARTLRPELEDAALLAASTGLPLEAATLQAALGHSASDGPGGSSGSAGSSSSLGAGSGSGSGSSSSSSSAAAAGDGSREPLELRHYLHDAVLG